MGKLPAPYPIPVGGKIPAQAGDDAATFHLCGKAGRGQLLPQPCATEACFQAPADRVRPAGTILGSVGHHLGQSVIFPVAYCRPSVIEVGSGYLVDRGLSGAAGCPLTGCVSAPSLHRGPRTARRIGRPDFPGCAHCWAL